MRRQRRSGKAAAARDERFREQALIPKGTITTIPDVHKYAEAGLVERVLPESILSAMIVIMLDGHGTCVHLFTRILPLFVVLLVTWAHAGGERAD